MKEDEVSRLEGKVAFITGAARGQGRAHAVRLASEGADVIAVDICRQISSVAYPLASEEDLNETRDLIEALDRRVVARVVDVRNRSDLQTALEEGVSELGRLDIVVANAGIMPGSMAVVDRDEQGWHDALDVMVTGAYHTLDVAIPAILSGKAGGSIVIISSAVALKGIAREYGAATPGRVGYTVAKHAVIGMMRFYASVLADHNIRVNTIHPTGVNTTMVLNDDFARYVQEHPSNVSLMQNALPVQMLEPDDVSNAVAWLCSDEARYITGTVMPVDAGFTLR